MGFRRKVRHVDTGLEAIPLRFNCPASWKEMSGDERVRHCTHCDRKVYNLSEMTSFEARSLMMRHEGRLCVRYYLRPDGKIMNRDCGNGVRIRARIGMALGAVLGALSLLFVRGAAPTPIASAEAGDGDVHGRAAWLPPASMGAPAVHTEPMMGDIQVEQIGKPMLRQGRAASKE